MGASHSVEEDVPAPEVEDPEPDEPDDSVYEEPEEPDDIHWLWPFI